MPCFRNIVLTLGLTSILQLAIATPVPVADTLTASCTATPVSKPVGTTPTLPLSGAATELPSTTLALQYVAIGRGIQNYTCTGAGVNGTALGAIATLFDATSIAYANPSFLNTIPPLIVNYPLPSTPLTTAAGRFPILGNHYFDALGTPTFNLSSVSKILHAAKAGDIKAPSTASKGPAGTGAVDWLFLQAKTVAPYVGASVGLSEVYRVVTAGGVAPLCTAAGVESVQYAAEYWFYL